MKDKYIFSNSTLKRILYDVKYQGKTIGLAHGAFDLFHVSHLDLLKKASKKCDFLIVGVDSDYNISKYKSKMRPVIPEEERLKIIAELNCVDAVFVNKTAINHKAYMKLYQSLYTDYLFTGENFQYDKELRYRSLKVGCKYVKINTKQIPSTSQIIDKILDNYKGNN